jgi:ATP-dependent helicase/nuclease subunit A
MVLALSEGRMVMAETLAQRVVNTFSLTKDQRISALERGRNVVVTAGAGSGKTRTLVARYASLLADELSPRQVVAITFTEKAAREMRSRLRGALLDLVSKAGNTDERAYWTTLNAQMDSARIGTIHSLCAELLRAHPAEAGVDPRFDVIDEGLAKTLKKQLVEAAVIQMVSQAEYRPLFQALETQGVQDLLAALLDQRLETRGIFASSLDGDAIVHSHLETRFHLPEIMDCVKELRGFTEKQLFDDAGDKLAPQITDLLKEWESAEEFFANGDLIACVQSLYKARREHLKKGAGKKGKAKEIHASLQALYDKHLDPLIGGKTSDKECPSAESEAAFKIMLPLIEKGFGALHKAYQSELHMRHALDFDDLEYGAATLLQQDAIRTVWQTEIQALLVDEFQDTNPRQRSIVDALAGTGGRLFVVGDDRQSIYRFRRADVSVFREVQSRAKAQGDLVLDLDITYRAHEPLLNVTGTLLAGAMGTEDRSNQPFYVPFRPLNAYRKTKPDHISDPHIEFILGAGADAEDARPITARALAQRLLKLRDEGQIKSWDDVALLFRASTGYPWYEEAFEDAGIPFVTVAGRGFYERPEIRDILNILRALADPADDLAMAGLLRSPAFGLSDSALYLLRHHDDEKASYWDALHKEISHLNEADQTCAKRAVSILDTLLPRVEREPVAELLKELVDAVDYRAILAIDDKHGSNGRLWRNLEKLITDAQDSGLVGVRDFLEYLTTLNDAGAREGEAPAEAQGAVRLMTIHKSKGLEFPVVILADATRTTINRSDLAYLLPEMGLSIKLKPEPMLYRLSKQLDDLQNEAESGRLLYVAMTRARDKLIISGHVSKGKNKIAGWMKDLCKILEIAPDDLLDEAGPYSQPKNAPHHPILVWCSIDQDTQSKMESSPLPPQPAEPQVLALYKPLIESMPIASEEDEEIVRRIWRATEKTLYVPPSVIGQMTHKALELWLHVDDPHLIPLLESLALDSGLATPEQRIEAVRRVRELIERFCAHPLREEIDHADERHHEVSYSRMNGNRSETGYIDLLYRKGNEWFVVDFKTDAVRSEDQYKKLAETYSQQLERYAGAVKQLLGQEAKTSICFLDNNGKTHVTSQ